MSDIDSMAATQATPPSLVTSSHASQELSQDASISHPRSPSPAVRSSKRRRLDTALPDMRANSSGFNHLDDSTNNSSPHIASQSARDLPPLFSSTSLFEPQPRTFMGHGREFMSHILSARGIRNRPRATLQHRVHIHGFRFGVEDFPVISADTASFIGWREKADTWPMEKGHRMQRSSTFPQ